MSSRWMICGDEVKRLTITKRALMLREYSAAWLRSVVMRRVATMKASENRSQGRQGKGQTVSQSRTGLTGSSI